MKGTAKPSPSSGPRADTKRSKRHPTQRAEPAAWLGAHRLVKDWKSHAGRCLPTSLLRPCGHAGHLCTQQESQWCCNTALSCLLQMAPQVGCSVPCGRSGLEGKRVALKENPTPRLNHVWWISIICHLWHLNFKEARFSHGKCYNRCSSKEGRDGNYFEAMAKQGKFSYQKNYIYI